MTVRSNAGRKAGSRAEPGTWRPQRDDPACGALRDLRFAWVEEVLAEREPAVEPRFSSPWSHHRVALATPTGFEPVFTA
jgi:hypothetical protein